MADSPATIVFFFFFFFFYSIQSITYIISARDNVLMKYIPLCKHYWIKTNKQTNKQNKNKQTNKQTNKKKKKKRLYCSTNFNISPTIIMARSIQKCISVNSWFGNTIHAYLISITIKQKLFCYDCLLTTLLNHGLIPTWLNIVLKKSHFWNFVYQIKFNDLHN